MENSAINELLIVGIIVIVGLLATVIYYFARYYFKTHEEDQQVIPQLKKEELTQLKKEGLAPLKKEEPEQPLVEQKERAPEPEAAPEPEIIEKPKLAPLPRKDLHAALEKTRSSLFGRIKGAFGGKTQVGHEDMEELEEALYTSDLGPQTVHRLVEAIDQALDSKERADVESVRAAIKAEMENIFESLPNGVALSEDEAKSFGEVLHLSDAEPHPKVWMIVGVNGAGKTTTIGKLANRVAGLGQKPLIVAGDTFRAAAQDQLKIWSERADVDIFSPPGVEDPSAVAFDACQSAKSKGYDVVIVDTAGRLHTQSNLMEQLKKMKRVINKVLPGAPHEILLVLDANSGQNALLQAKTFHEALDLTGIVLTKLDGTAKGGVAVSLAYETGLPIRLIGVGEGIEDLRPFRSKEFVDSII